jgi:type IV secretory pathway VirB6-like protein
MLTAPVLLFYLLHLLAVVELAVVKTLLKEILVNQVDQVVVAHEAQQLEQVIPLLHLHHKVIMALQVVVFKVVAEVALALAEVALLMD